MNTTPTLSAEQQARELANNIRLRPNSELGEYIEKLTAIIAERDRADAWESTLESYGVEPERVLEKIKLLEQKAEAFDWLEKFLLSEGGYIDMEASSTPFILANHITDQEWKGDTLLSAINQANKGQQ
jgi:hypothetical protein